jgi:type I restriction enzyme S subunit
MVESELGEIPKGWRVAFLDIECYKLYGYPFDSNLFSSISENNIPLIRIRDILNGYSDVYTSEDVDSKYLLENGDLLIGMDGTFHMSIWYNGNAYLNQRVVRFKTLSNKLTNLQVLYSIKQQIIDFENNIHGTTVAHLSDKHIKEITFLVGEERVQKLVTPLFSNLTKNMIIKKQETQKLEELKDLLLAKITRVESGKELV